MDSEFRYNTQMMQIDSINVEDIGNCALEAIDEDNCYYYIIVRTVSGFSDVITFGPVIPDIDLLPTGYESTFNHMSYTDLKIQKLIQKWVLGGKGVNFESVKQISIEEAAAQCRNAADQLKIKGA